MGRPGIFFFVISLLRFAKHFLPAPDQRNDALGFFLRGGTKNGGRIPIIPANREVVDGRRLKRQFSVTLEIMRVFLKIGRHLDHMPEIIRSITAQYTPQCLIQSKSHAVQIGIKGLPDLLFSDDGSVSIPD